MEVKMKKILLKITLVIFLTAETFAQDPFPGTALDFVGDTTDYAIISQVNNFPDTAITISFWMKTSDVTNNGTPVSYATASEDNIFLIYNYQDFHFRINNQLSANTGVSANDGNWHHITVSWHSADGQLNLYKDGLLSFSSSLATGFLLPDSGALVFGQEQDTVGGGFQASQSFQGEIEEVKLWNTVLSAQEIRENMHLTLSGSEPGLVSYWQFNEATGDTAYDVVGNNDAAIFKGTGSAWINSTIPAGDGNSFTHIVNTTGVFDFTGTNISMDFTTKTGTDTIVVSKLNLEPNTYPTTALVDTFSSQYWIVNKFGNGTFNTNLTFTPNEIITPEDQTSPNALRLFTRTSNSDTSWTEMMGSTIANASNNTVTYDSITAFCQFLICRQWFTDINAGLPGINSSFIAWGDYDNDGDLDILLTGETSYNNFISSNIVCSIESTETTLRQAQGESSPTSMPG